MKALQYALVAYVRSPAGEFVEKLREELLPDHGHLPAHVTVLPPRPLSGAEAEAVAAVERVCREVEPFEVVLGDVETFIPVTPTIFIRVAHAAYRLRELHDRLNANALHCAEQWPYMPHLTIVKLDDNDQAEALLKKAQQRWAQYQGPRRILVEQLTFVRESDDGGRWVDLAPIPLGSRLARAR